MKRQWLLTIHLENGAILYSRHNNAYRNVSDAFSGLFLRWQYAFNKTNTWKYEDAKKVYIDIELPTSTKKIIHSIERNGNDFITQEDFIIKTITFEPV